MAQGEAMGAWAHMPRRLSHEPATPPDLEESRADGILPGSLEDAVAALHLAKSYDIRITCVIPDAGVGSLIMLHLMSY
jgi:hypothetical protein